MTDEELWKLFPIILSDYDPRWPLEYEREKSIIEKAAGRGNVVRISHIGSTAVPGLTAKPTVDILLEIEKYTDTRGLITSLCGAGYIYTAQPRNPAPHMMFMKGYTTRGFEGQAFHLHVRYHGDWDELYFRDYLISNPGAAEEYTELKRRLAVLLSGDRDGYTAAKGALVRRFTALARKQYGAKYAITE